MIKFLLMVTCLILKSNSNLILNGNFEQSYGIPSTSNQFCITNYANSNYSSWYNEIGEYVEVKSLYAYFTSAYCQLSHNYPYTLCQNVLLSPGAQYQLNFSTYSDMYVMSSRITVKINKKDSFIFFTTNTKPFHQTSYTFEAAFENNQICFSSVDVTVPHYDWYAIGVDNITLIQIVGLNDISLSQTQKLGISIIISFPVKLIKSLRCIYLVMDDIWLYKYNKKNYTGLIESIFSTISTIQLLKFQFLEGYLQWNKYRKCLNVSDYSSYTTDKFLQVEGSPSVLIQSVFSFFVYTIPQNILLCLILYGMFHLLKNYKFSQYFRKFYFLKTVISIVIFQQNLGYLVFVCFHHIQHSFSFNLADKLSLIFTVLFLFGCFFFTFAFFLLVFRYLGKRGSYFTEFTYRQFAGIAWKTIHNLVRNLLRAAIFCFLHYQQKFQLIMLCVVQVLVLANCVVAQSIFKIFLSKTAHTLQLLYGFLFLIFNIVLLLEHEFKDGDIFLCIKQVEKVVIYVMIGNVILMVLVDLLGLKKLSKLNLGQSEEDNLDQVETSKRQKKVEIKENEAKPLQNKQKVKEKQKKKKK